MKCCCRLSEMIGAMLATVAVFACSILPGVLMLLGVLSIEHEDTLRPESKEWNSTGGMIPFHQAEALAFPPPPPTHAEDLGRRKPRLGFAL